MSDISLLGAYPSPVDDRDYKFASLLTPDEQTVELPPRYTSQPIPPRIVQQGGSCTGASATYMRLSQQKRDLGVWLKLDYLWLYYENKKIDGIPGEGSTLRASMRNLKNKGQALLIPGGGAVEKNKITTYYSVKPDADSIKRAIYTYGGIVLAGPWANSDFKVMSNGTLGKPDKSAGGHAFYAAGYDDNRACWDGTKGAVICINTWPLPWGYNGTGTFFYPYSRLGDPKFGLWEAYKAIDLPHS